MRAEAPLVGTASEQVSGPLARYEFFHNYERPHASLAYKTPNEYLVTLEAA